MGGLTEPEKSRNYPISNDGLLIEKGFLVDYVCFVYFLSNERGPKIITKEILELQLRYPMFMNRIFHYKK